LELSTSSILHASGVPSRSPVDQCRMRGLMNTIIKKMLPLIDILLAPFVFCSAFVLKSVRTIGVASLPISKRIMLSVGVFPIRDHYYEPLFNPRHINKPLSDDRCLPGTSALIRIDPLMLKKLTHPPFHSIFCSAF